MSKGQSRRGQSSHDDLLALYEEVRDGLVRHSVWLRVPPADAEDIVQEAFLRLHEHLRKEKNEANLRGWLFRVVHNLALTWLKSDKRTAALDDGEWDQIATTLLDAAPGPEDLYLERESMGRIHSRMKTLSPQQLHCLQLRAEGFRYHEIAEILGVTTSTVATSLRRAIEKLTEKNHE